MAMTSTKKEQEMDREYEVIELGVASSDTKGALVGIDDTEDGYKPSFGLSAD